MRTCIYCGRDKELKEFSQEHILPKSLVGTYEISNNPFITNSVCQYCNNVSGMFIDAPAVKSWFIYSRTAVGAADYAVIENNPVLPLHYMGTVPSLEFESKICDMYIGPAGDSIYHFHEPYPGLDELPPMIGVPPSIKRKDYDRGFAFLFIASNNPVWHPTIINSFVDAFKNSVLYCGNCENLPSKAFSEMPKNLLNLHSILLEMVGKKHKCSIKVSPNSEKRFLAKLALGIGSNIFGDTFIKSDDAALLRKFMWGKTPGDRENIPFKGIGFFNEQPIGNDLIDMFGLDGAIVITVLSLPEQVALTITLYNTISASLRICGSNSEYLQIAKDGICYVIVPGLKRIVGPIKMIEFLSHKLGMQIKMADLIDIEEQINLMKEKPPRMI